MSETKDCNCGTEDFSKRIANLKCVHCCHGNTSRKDQTSRIVLMSFWAIFLEIEIFLFKIIDKTFRKQENKPENNNL